MKVDLIVIFILEYSLDMRADKIMIEIFIFIVECLCNGGFVGKYESLIHGYDY